LKEEMSSLDDFGFTNVRHSLARLLELIQQANSVEQRAKLEETARELSTALKAMENHLRTLPGAENNATKQKEELHALMNLQSEADRVMQQLPAILASVGLKQEIK
jgi:hypothetical protein